MFNRGVNSVITEMPESRQECFVAAGGGGRKSELRLRWARMLRDATSVIQRYKSLSAKRRRKGRRKSLFLYLTSLGKGERRGKERDISWMFPPHSLEANCVCPPPSL